MRTPVSVAHTSEISQWGVLVVVRQDGAATVQGVGAGVVAELRDGELEEVLAQVVSRAQDLAAFLPVRIEHAHGNDTFVATPHGDLVPASGELAEAVFSTETLGAPLALSSTTEEPDKAVETAESEEVVAVEPSVELPAEVHEPEGEHEVTAEPTPDISVEVVEPEPMLVVQPAVDIPPAGEEGEGAGERVRVVHSQDENEELAAEVFSGGTGVEEQHVALPPSLHRAGAAKRSRKVGRAFRALAVVLTGILVWVGATWWAGQNPSEVVSDELLEAQALAQSARSEAYSALEATEGNPELASQRGELRAAMAGLETGAPTVGALEVGAKAVMEATAALVQADIDLAQESLDEAHKQARGVLREVEETKATEALSTDVANVEELLGQVPVEAGAIRLQAAHVEAATVRLEAGLAAHLRDSEKRESTPEPVKNDPAPSKAPVSPPPATPKPAPAPKPTQTTKPAPKPAPAPAPQPSPKPAPAPAPGRVTSVSVGSVHSGSSSPGVVTFSITVQTSGSAIVSGTASVGGVSSSFGGKVSGSKTFSVTITGVSAGSKSWSVKAGGIGPSGSITVY